MHVSSLPGRFSSGSFGKSARDFVDFLCECGFSYWQVLPFCMTDEYNSPYKSYSAFGANPYFIDLDILFEKGLITEEELETARQESPYLCEFERLRVERIPLLMRASERVKDKKKIERYTKDRPQLEKACEFMARRACNGDKPWYEWTRDGYDKDVLFGWKFIQYEFFTQWSEIKGYANDRGIKIIGDIPIYVSLDSCDVWSNKEQYLLDKRNMPTLVAGVPPDYFSSEGQLWGNPLYRWSEMKKDGYSWWRQRMAHMAEMFDMVRIDHFRALESFWAIPAKAKSAKEGSWKKGPGMAFIKAICEAAGNTEIIAEDLGDITDKVRELVKKSSFPGMRVFQFGFLSDDSIHRPHNYPYDCIAYTGTHDNNTLLGYLWELDGGTRDSMLSYCGHEGAWQDGLYSMMRSVFASHARLVMLPIQDVLGFGADTRLNTPGVPDGNWRYRVTEEQLSACDKQRFRYLNRLYSRQR